MSTKTITVYLVWMLLFAMTLTLTINIALRNKSDTESIVFLCTAIIILFFVFGVYFLIDERKSWKFVRSWKRKNIRNKNYKKEVQK